MISYGTAANRDVRRVRRLLSDSTIRLFHPNKSHEAGVFQPTKKEVTLLAKISVQALELLLVEGGVLLVRKTKAGSLYRAVPVKERKKLPRTAREKRDTAWDAAERAFPKLQCQPRQKASVTVADSPIGWLARRRAKNGEPFLTRDEVSAAERLRSDFERGQMAPGVTQDWKRFLTAGVEGGQSSSPQERDVDGGASAARERVADALSSLGPGLSDVAIRVCCFLEGIESIETSMSWSRRSGKVVLKIALHRLSLHYEKLSVRNDAVIESWQADEIPADESSI